MATIWDADVLIWAASQIVEARDAGVRTSRRMVATPHEILTFIGRGTSVRDYDRLKAALDRLQSTTVATSLRQTSERRMHRFSWINEWTQRADTHGRADGIDLIVPDWFYRAVLEDGSALHIIAHVGSSQFSDFGHGSRQVADAEGMPRPNGPNHAEDCPPWCPGASGG